MTRRKVLLEHLFAEKVAGKEIDGREIRHEVTLAKEHTACHGSEDAGSQTARRRVVGKSGIVRRLAQVQLVVVEEDKPFVVEAHVTVGSRIEEPAGARPSVPEPMEAHGLGRTRWKFARCAKLRESCAPNECGKRCVHWKRRMNCIVVNDSPRILQKIKVSVC